MPGQREDDIAIEREQQQVVKFLPLCLRGQKGPDFLVDLRIFGCLQAFGLEGLFEPSHCRDEGRRVFEGNDNSLLILDVRLQLQRFGVGDHPQLVDDFNSQPALRLKVIQGDNGRQRPQRDDQEANDQNR